MCVRRVCVFVLFFLVFPCLLLPVVVLLSS